MIVAAVPVRVVQPPLDQVVDVIAVRHRLMPTPLAVRVHTRRRLRMTAGMGHIDRNHVLVDVVVMRVMQMPVVQVIDVVFVADRRMPAVVAVNMRMRSFMCRVSHAATVQAGAAIANQAIARTIPAPLAAGPPAHI